MRRRSEHAVDAEVGRLVTFISLGAFRARRYRVASFHVKHPTHGIPRRWGSEEPRGGYRITPWRPRSIHQGLPPRPSVSRSRRSQFGMFHVKHARISVALSGFGATPPRSNLIRHGTPRHAPERAVRCAKEAPGTSQAARDAWWLSVRTKAGWVQRRVTINRQWSILGLTRRETEPPDVPLLVGGRRHVARYRP